MSQTFAEVQRKLGDEPVHLISVSIDPEQDTPARLCEYARKFSAGPHWTFYAGTLEASIAAQKAFGAYRVTRRIQSSSGGRTPTDALDPERHHEGPLFITEIIPRVE